MFLITDEEHAGWVGLADVLPGVGRRDIHLDLPHRRVNYLQGRKVYRGSPRNHDQYMQQHMQLQQWENLKIKK